MIKSYPFFIAINETGLCFKWYPKEEIKEIDFAKAARDYLFYYVDSGYVWDVCVAYLEDKKYIERVYFRIIFDINDFNNYNKTTEFARQVRKLTSSFYKKKDLTMAQILDVINNYGENPNGQKENAGETD